MSPEPLGARPDARAKRGTTTTCPRGGRRTIPTDQLDEAPLTRAEFSNYSAEKAHV